MPGGDRTGPAGMGPMTGRAAGYCAGYEAAGYMHPVSGRGFWGWGRGGGFGRGRGGGRGWQGAMLGWPAYGAPFAYPGPYDPAMTQVQERDVLKGQAEYFEGALREIRERIEELETKSEK